MISVTIIIPESLMPIERGEIYEDPLSDILWDNDLGEIIGGGGVLGEVDPIDGKRPIESCSIELAIKNLEVALPLIRKCLIESEAPTATTIRCTMADGSVIIEPLESR